MTPDEYKELVAMAQRNRQLLLQGLERKSHPVTRQEPTDDEIRQLILDDYREVFGRESDDALWKRASDDLKRTVSADVATMLVAGLIRGKKQLHECEDRLRRLELRVIQQGAPR